MPLIHLLECAVTLFLVKKLNHKRPFNVGSQVSLKTQFFCFAWLWWFAMLLLFGLCFCLCFGFGLFFDGVWLVVCGGFFH